MSNEDLWLIKGYSEIEREVTKNGFHMGEFASKKEATDYILSNASKSSKSSFNNPFDSLDMPPEGTIKEQAVRMKEWADSFTVKDWEHAISETPTKLAAFDWLMKKGLKA